LRPFPRIVTCNSRITSLIPNARPIAQNIVSSTIPSSFAPSRTIGESETTAKASLGSQGETCRLLWQSKYLSVAKPILRSSILGQVENQSLLDVSTSFDLLRTTFLGQQTLRRYSRLSSECDGVPRVTETYRTVGDVVNVLEGNLWVTLFPRPGIRLPLSPLPTAIPMPRERLQVEELNCDIPPEECSHQWSLFLEFLRSTVPDDLDEFKALFPLVQSKLDEFTTFPKEFLLRTDDLWGGARMSQTGLLTGSRFLDELVRFAHRNGMGMRNFFGGCKEARNAAIEDCQVGLERIGIKYPYNLADRSDQEATDMVVDYYGCSLQPAHAMVLHFAEEEAPGTKRNICANDGWGEESLIPFAVPGEQQKIAVTSAITFPDFYNPGT
jgi:hypothetical protein